MPSVRYGPFLHSGTLEGVTSSHLRIFAFSLLHFSTFTLLNFFASSFVHFSTFSPFHFLSSYRITLFFRFFTSRGADVQSRGAAPHAVLTQPEPEPGPGHEHEWHEWHEHEQGQEHEHEW
jgi:hypothetical protein